MTIVMAWRTDIGLMVAADTRISNEDSTLTDVGQKIFQIPVEITPFGLEGDSVSRLSVGFAFAGNTLLAQSCCVIASTCLTALSGARTDVSPAPEDFAALFARCAQYVCRERRFWTPDTIHRFESIVFGFDEPTGEVFLFELKTETQNGVVSVSPQRVELLPGRLVFFGSGAQAMHERLGELEKIGGRFRPEEILDTEVEHSKVPSVGGSLQFARATRDGVRLHPMMRVEPSGEASFSVLGCDIRHLAPIGEFIPGAGAVVFPRA